MSVVFSGVGAGFAFIPTLLIVEMHWPGRGNRLATSIALCGIGKSHYPHSSVYHHQIVSYSQDSGILAQ